MWYYWSSSIQTRCSTSKIALAQISAAHQSWLSVKSACHPLHLGGTRPSSPVSCCIISLPLRFQQNKMDLAIKKNWMPRLSDVTNKAQTAQDAIHEEYIILFVIFVKLKQKDISLIWSFDPTVSVHTRVLGCLCSPEGSYVLYARKNVTFNPWNRNLHLHVFQL